MKGLPQITSTFHCRNCHGGLGSDLSRRRRRRRFTATRLSNQSLHLWSFQLEAGISSRWPKILIISKAWKRELPLSSLFSLKVFSATTEDQWNFKLGFGQPPYPYGEQYYGLYSSTYGTQIEGRIMLPLNMPSDVGPIYVNAKQYNAIMRRRKSRAKAEIANQVLKTRKPYQHFSRHLHAKRRPRGNGGRFLNTKNPNTVSENDNGKNNDKDDKQQYSHLSESQISEVIMCDERVINSKGKNGNTSPGPEVTSHLFNQSFGINHIAFQSFTNTGIGIAMANAGNYLKV